MSFGKLHLRLPRDPSKEQIFHSIYLLLWRFNLSNFGVCGDIVEIKQDAIAKWSLLLPVSSRWSWRWFFLGPNVRDRKCRKYYFPGSIDHVASKHVLINHVLSRKTLGSSAATFVLLWFFQRKSAWLSDTYFRFMSTILLQVKIFQ